MVTMKELHGKGSEHEACPRCGECTVCPIGCRCTKGMIVRQIRITHLHTETSIIKEVTPEQHETILKNIALERSPVECELLKERVL